MSLSTSPKHFFDDAACQKDYAAGLAKGRKGEGEALLFADQMSTVLPTTKRYESYIAGIRQGLKDRQTGLVEVAAAAASGGGGGGISGESIFLLIYLGILWPVIAFGFALLLPMALLKWMTIGGKHTPEPEPAKEVKPLLTRIGIRLGLAFLGFIFLGFAGPITGLAVDLIPRYFKGLASHHYHFPDIWDWLEWYVLSPLLALALVLWSLTLWLPGIKFMLLGRFLPKRYDQ